MGDISDLYCSASGEGWVCRRVWSHQESQMCAVHRNQAITRGELIPLRIDSRVRPPTRCSFQGCPRPGRGQRSLCDSHQNQLRTGKTLRPIHRELRVSGGCIAETDSGRCEFDAAHRTGLCTFHHTQRGRNPQGPYRDRKLRSTKDVLLRDAEGRKKCPVCEEWKNEDLFYGAKNTSDKKQPACKECYWVRNLLRRFGVSRGQYFEILDRQGGVCAICQKPSEKRLEVDHDHKCCSGEKTCGKCIRSLLCFGCNSALGFIREDVDSLKRMINYVEGFKNV